MTWRGSSWETPDSFSYHPDGLESHAIAPYSIFLHDHLSEAGSPSSSSSHSVPGGHNLTRRSHPQIIPHPSSSRIVNHTSRTATPSTSSAANQSFPAPLQYTSHPPFSSRAPHLLTALRERSHGGTLQRGERPSACDRCRKRKIKCDRRKPICGTCIRLGTDCSNQDVLKRRGPPASLSPKQRLGSFPTNQYPILKDVTPRPFPVETVPDDIYVPQASSLSDPGVILHPPSTLHGKRSTHGLTAAARSKAHRPETILEEALPLPPMPSLASPPNNDEIPVPESILAAEVVTAASVVVHLMAQHQLAMPPLGGFDQLTAAYLSRKARSKKETGAPGEQSQSQVASINRFAKVQVVGFDTFPRTMSEMCTLYPQSQRGEYLASAGIDVNDVTSVRAGACKLLAHPAALQLHNFAKLFQSRAPTCWSPDIEATLLALAKGQVPRVSVAWLGMCLATVAIGTANSPPLSLDDIGDTGNDPGHQPELAVLIEFGLTCYYLSSEIADRSLDLYDVSDTSAGLAQLQVTSWLSTTSLFSEDPQKWHVYWSLKAWGICKHYGFHKVNRLRSGLLHQNQMDPATADYFPTPAHFKVELVMRAVWGLVIVAALQSIISNTNRCFLDEEVECDYPSSLTRDGTPAAQHPNPEISDECFESWSQFVHIQHLYVRMITGRLGQKSFWVDVSKVESDLADSARDYLSSAAAREPAKRWLDAVAAVLEARLVILDQLCAEFEGIAADADAYKAHNAQPRLPSGRTDLSGWLFVKNQALRTLSIIRRRLADWESELSDGLRLLEAMECPLPPSLSGTPSLTSGEEDEGSVEHIDDAAYSDVTIGGVSLGAMTMPETLLRRQYTPGKDQQLDTTPAQSTVSNLRSRLSRRSALETRVGNWLADVPDAPPLSDVTSRDGKGFKSFVAGDVL